MQAILEQFTAQVNVQVEAQLRERVATIQMLQDTHDSSLALYEGVDRTEPVDEVPEIVVGSNRYPYPNPSQQHTRAVWRNHHFTRYLKSIGMEGRAVLPGLVTNWFKRCWFGDARLGAQRLADAGFTPEQLTQLTTHHIIPRDIGGRDSIYNYHLVLSGLNSHLGSMFTKEGVAWVGAEHAHVAKSFAKFANRQTADGLDARKFDPFALACPQKAIGKRRLVVTDVVAGAPPKQVRLGALLEVRFAVPELASSTLARVEEVDAATPPRLALTQTPRPVTGGESGGIRINKRGVMCILASSGRGCLLPTMTDRFVTQAAKKIRHSRLKDLAFTQQQGTRPEQVRYGINSGWVVLPVQNTAGTFGEFVFAANSGNSLRRLVSISRDDLLMCNIAGETGVEDADLLFQEFDNRTLPIATMPPQTNMLPYLLLSTILFDHAVSMAASPSIISRLGDADSMMTHDRVEAERHGSLEFGEVVRA